MPHGHRGDGRSGPWRQGILADLIGPLPRPRPGPISRLIGGPSGSGAGRGHQLDAHAIPSSGVRLQRRAMLARDTAIEDGGTLRWYAGTPLATIGSGWSGGLSDASGVVLDPGARPGLAFSGATLFVIAVGSEGWLYATTIDPVAQVIHPLTVVDTQVTIGAQGPLGLGVVGDRLVALTVGTDLILRTASRPIAPGGAWSELVPVDDEVGVSPLGGVTAVVLADLGIAALVTSRLGGVWWALSSDGVTWSPLEAA